MKISDKGLDLIKEFEGFRSHAYLCPAGVPTIGYGNTRYNDGRKVDMSDDPITKLEATNMLRYQVDKIYGKAVNDAIGDTPTTQSQFDAMVSFAYNLGGGALKKSTLLKHHNDSKHEHAANEFGKWVKAGGKTLAGLVRRREAEKLMYEG